MGSKGGSSAPTESTVTQTNLPEYAEPFYRDLLTRVGYESSVQYDPYKGRRLEYFSPAEQEAMRRFEQMGISGTPPELDAAGSIAAQVGTGSPYADTMLEVTRRAQEMPGYASGFRQGNVYHGYGPGTVNQTYLAGQDQLQFVPQGTQPFAPSVDYTAGQFDPGYDPARLGREYQARELQSQYGGIMDIGPRFDPGTMASRGAIESYMSPYQQLVVDREKREAQRQSEIMGQQMGLQAAGAGSLGGYREAIMQAERERNLEDQLGDIQAAGSQRAFEQAQRAFEADRAARLQASQLGLQTGQAQQQALQEAERFRQAAFGATESARQQQQQFDVGIYQAGEAARQQAAQMGLTAQQQEEAARQAEQQFRMKAFESGIGARAQSEKLRLQQQQQNEQARQRQMELNLSAYQANQQARQQAAQLGLSAQEQEQRGRIAEEQARRAAQQMNLEQARTAATLGQQAYGQLLSGDQQRLAAAGLLGDFSAQRQQMEMERLRAMQASGQIQRELMQRGLDIGYADFLRQQAYPKEQLSFYSSMLQGIPIAPGQVSQAYGVTPSMTQQLLGSGIAGVGLYNAFRG